MKITFVLPFYKVKKEYMDQSIRSVLGQTYSDIEIILVDDGSPDLCGQYCDEYAEMDERIKVIHKKNGGLSDARNAGLASASSEWITFLDGDDWVDLEFAQAFAEYISGKTELADIYYFSGYRNYPNKEVVGVPYFETGKSFETYEERENLQTKCFTNHVAKDGNRKGITVSSAWAKIYNTNFLRSNGLLFPIVPYDEDSLFFLETIEVAKKIEYIALPIYHYRFTEGSIVNKYRKNAISEQNIYLNYIFDFANRNNKKIEFRNKIYMRVMTSMLLLIKQYFYNEENRDSIFKKHKKCASLFKQTPYSDMFANVAVASLGKNARIKYLLLKLKQYYLLEYLRKRNFRNNYS